MKKSQYHIGRLGKDAQLTYRLKRRTSEVLKVLKGHVPIDKILDIGTADGLMLTKIKSEYNDAQCFGIDISIELLKTNKDTNIKLMQADAEKLPFKDYTFDLIIATALAEHLSSPSRLLKEIYRLLNSNGLFIITFPDPFWLKVAKKLKFFDDKEHKSRLDMNILLKAIKSCDFEVLKTEKFMLSPIGFPFELIFERFYKKIGVDYLLLNNLVVGIKR